MRDLPVSAYLPRVLPDGWRVIDRWGDGYRYIHRGGLRVICDTAPIDGREWMHVSCSREDRLPSWDDMKHAKETFVGNDRYAYQVFPPASKYVNHHPFVLHMYVALTGKPPLPDFTFEGKMI
jgi:hypothetical protein